MDRKKILIVDDEKDLRNILSYNLTMSGYEVLEASNGLDAIKLMETEGIDMVILDIMMPGKDGYEVCREIRERGYKVPIIFLTAKDTEFDEVLGLELGADDYVKKPFGVNSLISRVKSIFRRIEDNKKKSVEKIIKYAGLEIDLEGHLVRIDGKKVEFPKKEFELLAFLASNPGKVYPREVLLEKIWRGDVYVIDRTVDVHIGRIRKKLGRYSDYIQTIVGVGYKFRTDL
ncbi:MAG: response regulator transcription factor [Candidatus Marinimicrobia bacterium]|nr:response regulator transcription factor [Candidatus Neomarinimicrobiota bacterium]